MATGALRGAGNTRIPMIANFIGYWVIGLPLGAFLCFKLKMGAVGMWLGLVFSSGADWQRPAGGVAGDNQETYGDKSNSKRGVIRVVQIKNGGPLKARRWFVHVRG